MKVRVQVADLEQLLISRHNQRAKRKRSVSDKAEKMESLVEKVMKMQSESEQHYLRLEDNADEYQ